MDNLKTRKLNPEITDKDNPEWSDAMFPNAKRGSEVVKKGRKKSKNPKQSTTIRLSADVIEFFKLEGSGWQTRINNALKEYILSHK